MKYKIVVFGTKQSTISLLDVIKHDVDLIVTIDNTTSHHISGKGDVGHYAEIEDINCYSTSDYSLKSCQDFFENNEFVFHNNSRGKVFVTLICSSMELKLIVG